MCTVVDEIKKHLRLIAAYVRFNLSAVMEYRVSFLLQVFGMVLNNASFIFFWRIVYTRMPLIAGYGFEDVMFGFSPGRLALFVSFALFGGLLIASVLFAADTLPST